MTFCSYSKFINDSCQKSVELSRAYLGVHQTAIILLSVSYAYQCKHQLQCFTWEDNLNRNPQSLWRVLNNLALLENERGIYKTRSSSEYRDFSRMLENSLILRFRKLNTPLALIALTALLSNYRGHCSDTRYITSKRRVQILLYKQF